jgi:hypothetical protein
MKNYNLIHIVVILPFLADVKWNVQVSKRVFVEYEASHRKSVPEFEKN